MDERAWRRRAEGGWRRPLAGAGRGVAVPQVRGGDRPPPAGAWGRLAGVLVLAGALGAGCGRAGSGAELIVQVVAAPTGAAIPWAVVHCGGQTQRASAAGLVRFAPLPGPQALDVGAAGFLPRFGGHQVEAGAVAFRVVALDPVATPGVQPPFGSGPLGRAPSGGLARPARAQGGGFRPGREGLGWGPGGASQAVGSHFNGG